MDIKILNVEPIQPRRRDVFQQKFFSSSSQGPREKYQNQELALQIIYNHGEVGSLKKVINKNNTFPEPIFIIKE